MQNKTKCVLILTMILTILTTTACSQAAVDKEPVTSPTAQTTAATTLAASTTEGTRASVSETEVESQVKNSETSATEAESTVTEQSSQSLPETAEPLTSETATLKTSAAVDKTDGEDTPTPAPDEKTDEGESPESPPDETDSTDSTDATASTNPTGLTSVPTEELTTIEDTKVAMSDSEPKTPSYPSVSAPGLYEERCSDAVIDYSNTEDGYIMVKFTSSTSNRLKVLVQGPSTKYQYDIKPDEWSAFPLSDGDGTYAVGVYENVQGTSYAQVLTANIRVSLTDEFAPFLRSNQYVDFESAPDTVSKASDLCEDADGTLEKVGEVYDFVVSELSYDYDLASNVKSGYVPDLDKVLSKEKGICLDYAGLMTGMLRSQCIPCKLVVGYAGTAYHAWISVWSDEEGWIEDVIYFDGESWKRMDPTFASTGDRSKSTMKYIGDGKNYSAKFYY